jgi:tRNA 2-thiouridine synthesizing protein A
MIAGARYADRAQSIRGLWVAVVVDDKATSMSIDVDHAIDCSGMPCPEPIRRAKHALDTLRFGQVLKIIVTDAGAPADVREWAQRAGRRLVASEQHNDTHTFYIRRTE